MHSLQTTWIHQSQDFLYLVITGFGFIVLHLLLSYVIEIEALTWFLNAIKY
jgi:hypothetical protein